MNRKEAKAKGKLFYIGSQCGKCGETRSRYVSDGSCRRCRQNRDSRKDIGKDDMALLLDIRARDREAKRAQRARAKEATPSIWQSIITQAQSTNG